MNREFKPKLKAFMRDYQSPYRYSSANLNNRSVEVHQTSVEQHFALAPDAIEEHVVEETRADKPRNFRSRIPKVSGASPKAKHSPQRPGEETPKQSRSLSAKHLVNRKTAPPARRSPYRQTIDSRLKLARKGHSVEPFEDEGQCNVTLNIELPHNRLTEFGAPNLNRSID